MTTPVLVVDKLRKSYASYVALREVSFEVRSQERFGLLGPNGAGKTTLMSLLTGLSRPDAGTIRFLGELFEPRNPSHQKRIGLATQDLAIYPELTALENVLFFGKLYGLRGADLRQRAIHVLRDVGLEDRAEQRTHTFSGGMKRRLNLAVAVVHRPTLVLLDEPTTGVDPQSRNHIFERVQALHHDGVSVVYTSHYMEEVQALCPRIAILDQGMIQACASLEELLQMLPQVALLRFPKRLGEDLERGIAQNPGIQTVSYDSATYKIVGTGLPEAIPRILAECFAAGIRVERLEVTRPNLEDVFLHLTGRDLRD